MMAMTHDQHIGQPQHLTSELVQAEVALAREMHAVISDACAVTIASWWMSPDAAGWPFNRLASVGTLNAGELIGEIAILRSDPDMTDEASAELDALVKWAQHRHDEET